MATVLVIEDSSAIRLLLRRRLEMVGHRVFEAEDGVEACEALENSTVPAPDIALMDAMMPRLSGAKTLSRIREAAPALPVILISAIDEFDIGPGLEEVDLHMTKPIDFAELLSAIESLTGTS